MNLDEILNRPASVLLPGYKSWMSDLEDQRKAFEKHELEAGKGPEPTQTAVGAGETEMWHIKKQSSFSYGDTVVRNKNKGLQVLTLLDENRNEAEEYRTVWQRLEMDRKLEVLKRDYRIGGTAYSEVGVINGKPFWNVKSPKTVTTFSSDPVNSLFADFAIERFTVKGVSHFKYYDGKGTFVFRSNDNDSDWTLIKFEENYLGGICPIVPMHNSMTSDGKVTGDIELLKPIFDTLRQRTNATSQAVYWMGSKLLVVEGIDIDDVRTDADGNEYSMVEFVTNSIRMTDSGVVLLPTGTTNGVNPKLSQTDEANIVQLVEAKKDALRDLAANSGLPYHLFDGTATPTTGEGTIQAYLSTSDDKNLDKKNIGTVIERVLGVLTKLATGEEKYIEVVWAVSEQVSINNIADTISKLFASGFPLPWIVRNVLAGYRPAQINELLEEISARQQMANEQMQFISEGI